MKRYTIAVAFDWKNSDDGMFDNNRPDETRYLIPEEARNRRDEVFVCRDDLTVSTTYSTRDDANNDFIWLKDMHDRWMNGGWEGEDPVFPENMIDEFPDHCAEFIFPVEVEEVEVN